MTETDTTNSNSRELLTFKLADEEYALDIMSVREIRGWTRTTPMPHAPAYMRGVINLRGTVLPVLDLAARLGLPPIETTPRNVIIVVHDQDSTTGLLVDAVSDIVTLSDDDLQPPPEVQSASGLRSICALSLKDDRMIRILALTSVLGQDESAAA